MTFAETVWGRITPEQFGVTTLHEHVLLDMSIWSKHMLANLSHPIEASSMRYVDEPVSMELLGKIKRGEIFCKDNVMLNDERLIEDELMEFKKWGGRTIVDQSLPGIGRDPLGLRRISALTGLNIIAGTGFYTHITHPAFVRKADSDQLAQVMIKEITEGIGTTGVKAGVIGECGCSEPVPWHPEEEKVLRAACRTQRITKVAFTFHPSLRDTSKMKAVTAGEEYVDLIEKEGADPTKFYLSHADWSCYLPDYVKYAEKLLDRGITLGLDTWGMEVWGGLFSYPGARSATDPERLELVKALCEKGFEKQITLSTDLCEKVFLKKYGGHGYSHILEHIVPLLRLGGVSGKQVDYMTIENAKRILCM